MHRKLSINVGSGKAGHAYIWGERHGREAWKTHMRKNQRNMEKT